MKGSQFFVLFSFLGLLVVDFAISVSATPSEPQGDVLGASHEPHHLHSKQHHEEHFGEEDEDHDYEHYEDIDYEEVEKARQQFIDSWKDFFEKDNDGDEKIKAELGHNDYFQHGDEPTDQSADDEPERHEE
ncbi:hypothetical protein TcWFU_009218 [Taenia crassiceps]|uniref:Uncharacterized protein n=1 Tax=Taenia crassiceps TaxID=6207 RepID=A0ABR4QC15_9CEST